MAEESVFRGVIEFLGKIGVYDVILPFLLVFTIIFAILEKTRVLGTEEIDGKKYSKKNINAMVAFVMSFLVVASTKLVAVINILRISVIPEVQVVFALVVVLVLFVLFV